MSKTDKIALAEVYEILKYLTKEECERIPSKLMEFIKANKDDNYKVNIKRPLNTKDYSREAIVLIGMIYNDYLCN